MDKIDTLKMFQSTVLFIDFHEQLQLKKQQNLEALSNQIEQKKEADKKLEEEKKGEIKEEEGEKKK